MNLFLKIVSATLVVAVVGAAALLAALIYWVSPNSPYTRSEIAFLTDQLNYNTAVVGPHKNLGRNTRNSNLSLFEKVERGELLTAEESANYRALYQSILREKQWYLALFDWSLTPLSDHAMSVQNNVGGHGIAGRHDHHDASARANLRLLEESVARIENARGVLAPFTRVINALSAYKDTTDLILHMATAPPTKSVPYSASSSEGPIKAPFEGFLREYKAAQFALVNSTEYRARVHGAMSNYDELVFRVQEKIVTKLHPWERALTGRWLGWQSFGPSFDEAAWGPYRRPVATREKEKNQ